MTISKTKLAKRLGIARSTLYYQPKQPIKDLETSAQIEKVLDDNPGYGHKRIAQELKINKKRSRRVMKLFDLKPRRRRRKPSKRADLGLSPAPYLNLLLEDEIIPDKPSVVWATDFTYLPFLGRFIYLATVF